MLKSIYQLRKENYKVRVCHSRYIQTCSGTAYELKPLRDVPGPERFPRGGMTVVEITTPKGNNYSAVAKCNLVDAFDRKKGVKIALGRIEKSLMAKSFINYCNERSKNDGITEDMQLEMIHGQKGYRMYRLDEFENKFRNDADFAKKWSV